MAITVGRVIDLNFEPFYIDMERRGIVLQEVSLKDMPQALRDGSVNAGPVSLVDSLALEDVCNPIAGFCLAASNRAGSNLLYSKKPMEELSGGTIAAATSDLTTQKLFQVLLAEKHNGSTESFVSMPEEHDAFVISGDDALRRRRGARGYQHRYDLGEEWHAMTNLPFVFARWMARKELDDQEMLLVEDTLYVGLEDGVDSLFHLAEPKDHLLMMARDIVEYIIGYRYFVGLSERKSIDLFKEYLANLKD
ncbi:MAG: MqnA/MqnD/SBP family protein [Chloroflexota bacterium]|jgi:chorismate dehydratase|nr:MqnA/MqnD/SBP family protein [Chloroflexota bacterium]|tara:strand:+ start:566 stop:1315 length:750 start_codon:yes stop_codon:yes gene_type:complete